MIVCPRRLTRRQRKEKRLRAAMSRMRELGAQPKPADPTASVMDQVMKQMAKSISRGIDDAIFNGAPIAALGKLNDSLLLGDIVANQAKLVATQLATRFIRVNVSPEAL